MQTPIALPPPKPWPQRLLAVLGLVSLVVGIAFTSAVGGAEERRDAVDATLRRASLTPEATDAQRALISARRDLASEVARWKRRRTGLLLTSFVLFAGAFGASALRRLHLRGAWAVIDDGKAD